MAVKMSVLEEKLHFYYRNFTINAIIEMKKSLIKSEFQMSV